MSDKFEGHTVRRYDDELNSLHSLTLEMGGLVLNQLCQALAALKTRDLVLAREIIHREREVNHLEVMTDTRIFKLLAKRCPVAGDLRAVMAASKIINNLERIGDEAAKIANFVLCLYASEGNDPDQRPLQDVYKMGETAVELLKNALEVFDHLDETKTEAVSYLHIELDKEFEASLHRLMDDNMKDARNIGNSVSMVLMIKALERIGDHAQNIAEYVIFQIKGEDIRHRIPDFGKDFQKRSAD